MVFSFVILLADLFDTHYVMKKLFIGLFTVSLLMSGCSDSGHTSAPSGDVVITHHEMSSEVNKTVANLSIEGMTCAAGCGGKIQQDLRAMKGVINTTLDFVEERSQNVVSVEFDPSVVQEQDLIKCVAGIADGQYKVVTMDVVTYKGLQSSGAGNGSGASVTDSFGKVFKVLNLLESVARIIRQ